MRYGQLGDDVLADLPLEWIERFRAACAMISPAGRQKTMSIDLPLCPGLYLRVGAMGVTNQTRHSEGTYREYFSK
jgi:hypothetical protein